MNLFSWDLAVFVPPFMWSEGSLTVYWEMMM